MIVRYGRLVDCGVILAGAIESGLTGDREVRLACGNCGVGISVERSGVADDRGIRSARGDCGVGFMR